MPFLKSLFPPIPLVPPMNFHTFLFEVSPGKNIPRNHTVYIDGLTGEKWTLSEFIERVRDIATALVAPVEVGGLGVNLPGRETKEIVAILSPNCLEYISLVHALLAVTVPFALLPSHPTLSELTGLLAKSKATRLFVHPSLLKQAIEAAQKVGLSSNNICLIGGEDKFKNRIDLNSLIQNIKTKNLPRQPVVPANKDTLAYLIFSSGTGGLPKGVMASHGNLCYSTLQMLVALQEASKLPLPNYRLASTQNIWLCFLPFYHVIGLHFCMFRSLLFPTTTVVLPRWNIDTALEAIPKYKITSLAAVPSIIHQLVHSPKTAKADLSSITMLGSGGAHLPAVLNQKVKGIFKTPSGASEGYGLSEATIGCMSRPPDGLFGRKSDLNSTGILMPGLEARIVREDGSEADYDEPGELWVRGGNVVLGYWNDEKATKDTFLPDGWLRTGDRFRVNRDGTFYYEDRLKDTLKISGAQVSPVELERTLLSQPDGLIVDVAVAGVPGGRISDERIPRAWIVLSDNGKKLGVHEVVNRLEAWSKEHLSHYKWLTGGFEVVKEIPKNPTGKVLRRTLVDSYIKMSPKAKL